MLDRLNKEYDIDAIFNQGFVPSVPYQVKDMIYYHTDKMHHVMKEVSKSLLVAKDSEREVLKAYYNLLNQQLGAIKHETELVEKIYYKFSLTTLHEIK